MRPMLPRRLFCSTVHKPEPRSSLRRLKWSCSMFIVLFHQKLLFHGLTFFGNFGGGTVGGGLCNPSCKFNFPPTPEDFHVR